MAIEQLAKAIIKEQFSDLVNRVYEDFVQAALEHKRSGEAANSIRIIQQTDTHALIGSANLHLYYLDQGNGGKGVNIFSTRAVDRRGYPPGKLKLRDGSFRVSVRGYEGFHIAKKVADKYR